MLKTTSIAKQLIIALGLGLAALYTATPAKAAVLTYQGDTTNQPTWRRTAPGDPPDRISGENAGTMGMTVPYSVFQFTVEESGLYSFGSTVPKATSPTNGAWDNFLVLYQDSFNPNNQLTNVLVAAIASDNDSPVFNRQLTAQRNYFLVTTGRQVTDEGAFINTISGSGKIVPVPESASVPSTQATVAVCLLLYKRKPRQNLG